MASKQIKNVIVFLKWVEEQNCSKPIYRGLCNAVWKIESSALRRASKKHLDIYNSELIKDSQAKGFDNNNGKLLTELELLGRMQHHGAATSLIDFTYSPLVALYFACEPSEDSANDDEPGKVVVIDSRDEEIFSVISPSTQKRELKKLYEEKKLWKWEPSHLTERITAQNSVFIFRDEKIQKINQDQFVSVCIASDSKKKICAILSKDYGIDHKRLFPDFDGYCQSNSYKNPYLGPGKSSNSEPTSAGSDQDPNGGSGADLQLESTSIDHITAQGYFEIGVKNLQLQDYSEAIQNYNRAIDLNPNYTRAYHNRGSAKGALGQRQDALKDYDKAIELNPNSAETYNNRGVAKNDLGQHEDAKKDYDKAIELNPNSAEMYNNRGVAKNNLRQRQDALKDYDKAIELNPNSAETYNNRGVAKNKLGQHEDALKDYDKAIELNPTYASAYNNRGLAKQKLGQHDAARIDFDKATELDPDKFPQR